MKTKEEIEKLANDFYLKKAEAINNSITRGFIVSASKGGFVQGYTQCQEDMSKDVEYWQGEFEQWYRQAMDMSNKYNELLNKKDNENII
jgi:hypothetical protein